jgi:hypothetical protein
MNEVLLAAADKASRKREYMIQRAKSKGPSAAFYVGLVSISKVIDHAKQASVGSRDDVVAAMVRLRSVTADTDLRYQSEREEK